MNIFLSYASEHRETAERICLKLVGAGHEVFFDRLNLQPGHAFDTTIKGEVDRCDLFLFLLAPESIERGSYALTEVDLVQRKWPNPEGRVLVVDLGLVGDQRVPPYLTANILLQPKGDPATEALFAVERMVESMTSPGRAQTSPATHATSVGKGTPGVRRWLLPAAVAVAALIAVSILVQVTRQPAPPSIQATGGLAAGSGITVGGDVNIGGGGAGADSKDTDEP